MYAGIVNEISGPPITGQSFSLTHADSLQPSSPISGLEDSH